MNCEFSDPVNLGTDSWAYSQMDCTFSEGENPLALIESATSEGYFYMNPSLTYGDVIIFIFLSLFTIAIICKAIGDFVFSRWSKK